MVPSKVINVALRASSGYRDGANGMSRLTPLVDVKYLDDVPRTILASIKTCIKYVVPSLIMHANPLELI
jgi:hypothetical protein